MPEIISSPTVPTAWLSIEGNDRTAGTGYTRWRDWSGGHSVMTAISYQSYTSGVQSLRAKIVGLYLDAEGDHVLGVLAKRRIKGVWAEEQLILLKTIEHWADLDSGLLIHGDSLVLATHVLQTLHDQLANSRVSKEEGKKTENKHIRGECLELSRGMRSLVGDSLVTLLDSLDEANPEILDTLRASLNAAEEQIL